MHLWAGSYGRWVRPGAKQVRHLLDTALSNEVGQLAGLLPGARLGERLMPTAMERHRLLEKRHERLDSVGSKARDLRLLVPGADAPQGARRRRSGAE